MVPTRRYVEFVVGWVRNNGPALGNGRVALVVAGGIPAAYGMARMLELLAAQRLHVRGVHIT